jgi:hypothetical protein
MDEGALRSLMAYGGRYYNTQLQRFISKDPLPLRSKLRNMTETELVQFGKALRDKWDKFLNADQKKNLIELKEARAEWRRRHPKRRTSP